MEDAKAKFKKELEKELLHLERLVMGSSQTEYNRYRNDISNLQTMYKDYFGEYPRVLTKSYPAKGVDLLNIVFNYRDALFNLGESLIETYKQSEFCYYGRDLYAKLSTDDYIDLLSEFLNYFNRDMAIIYNDIYDNNRLLAFQDEGIYGISYLLPNIDKYYIGIDDVNTKSDITIMETIVHELAHVYTAKFLSNYQYKGMNNLLDGLFTEVISLYSELSFYNFLLHKWEFRDSALYHRNSTDAELLSEYKGMRYLVKALIAQEQGQNVSVQTDGFKVWVEGEFDYDPDKDVPFYRNYKTIKEGTLSSILYSAGIVKAYELYERELSGEKPRDIINEYLISLQGDNLEDEFLSNPIDLSFMKREMSERNKILYQKQFESYTNNLLKKYK